MNWFWLIYLLVVIEIITNILFHYINEWLKEKDIKETANSNRRRQILKGILERAFLVSGLLIGYPQVIIAFGALKIGTRFQKNNKISNDYFLIGNFISLLIALLFVVLAKHAFNLV